MSVGLASPQSAGWAAGWETREELVLQLESEGCLLADSHLQEGQTFGLLRPSTDQMRPIHTFTQRPLFPCKSHPPNPPSETPRTVFDHTSGCHGSVKVKRNPPSQHEDPGGVATCTKWAPNSGLSLGCSVTLSTHLVSHSFSPEPAPSGTSTDGRQPPCAGAHTVLAPVVRWAWKSPGETMGARVSLETSLLQERVLANLWSISG